MTKRINQTGNAEVAFGYDREKKQPFMRISTNESDYVELSVDDARWIQKNVQGFLNLFPKDGETHEESESESGDEPHLTYIETANMGSVEEIKDWEKKENACVLYSDAGGIMELKATHLYSLDNNGNRVAGSERPCVGIAMCDDVLDNELILVYSSKTELRKLRDYLNRCLEEWK